MDRNGQKPQVKMNTRILLVEDEASVRDSTHTFLVDEGYACEAVASGTDALARLEQQAFAVVLTDIRLPGIDGLALVERANALQPDTPKIIMSAHSDFELTLQAIRLGAYDFIPKPFRSLEHLAVAIRRAVQHHQMILQRRDYERRIEEMNQKLAQLNAELEEEVHRRTEELIHANRQLRTLDEMKNNLLANVSHELRTPLVSVRGYVELFADGHLCEIPSHCVKYLHTCMRNVDKLLALIEGLVNYADMARDGVELELTDIDLRALLEEVTDAARSQATARQVGLALTVPKTPIPAHIDRRRMGEALRHLLDNAIKFNQAGGTVQVAVDNVGTRLAKVWIHDTGIGIAESEQGHIFDRFYQVDAKPTRRHGGTGMGLTIARDNLRLMGCELRVSSQLGKGSTFHFTVPTQLVDPGPHNPLGAVLTAAQHK